jgi:hypothetical protein
MKKKAAESFNLLFPTEVLPDIVKGRDMVYKLALKTGNEHIKAISKLSGKYAYYVDVEDGKIVEEYDLLTGKRIA